MPATTAEPIHATIEEILAEDARAEAREVWLLDTGSFLVIDAVHPACFSHDF